MLDPVALQCTWCGEPFDALVDVSGGSAEYIEDCPVCCQPMLLRVRVDPDGAVAADAERAQ